MYVFIYIYIILYLFIVHTYIYIFLMPYNDLQSTTCSVPHNCSDFITYNPLCYRHSFLLVTYKHTMQVPPMPHPPTPDSGSLHLLRIFSPQSQISAWLSLGGSFRFLLNCHFLSEAFSGHLKCNPQPSFSLSLPLFFLLYFSPSDILCVLLTNIFGYFSPARMIEVAIYIISLQYLE